MDIAFFHHTLCLGSGIDTVIYELANRLGKKDNVTVFCFKSSYRQEDCEFRICKINSAFANSRMKMNVIAPFIMDKVGCLKSDLKKFDVINTHHYPANYIVRNVDGPLNIVTEWSAVRPSMFSSLTMKLYVKWTSYANKIAAKKANIVLAPCEFVKNWVAENYQVNATTMFLDGVNFEIFDRSTVNPDKIFQLYPSVERKKIILFVGRITESKNIHSLLEVLTLVRKRIPDVVLVLVGDYNSYPSYYARLIHIIKEKEIDRNVIFTGIVPWEDLPSYFAACTVYTTCSLWEGFLRAEAYAFGKPIVCFDVGANSESVNDGETGFLISDLSINKFTEKVCELLTNDTLARKMGQNGYLWARENLDFNSISEKFRVLCHKT